MKRKVPKPTRTWIKLYCAECIRGSIRTTLTPAERSVWYDLLLMAGDSRVDGVICATKGVPYPYRHIANTLAIPLPLLQSCLKKFKEQDRITEDGDGIHIQKWRLYQRPYQSKLPWPEEKDEPEEPEATTPEQQEQQAEQDAKDLDELKAESPDALEEHLDHLSEERLTRAKAWKAAHPNRS